jgi:hypothetical protein
MIWHCWKECYEIPIVNSLVVPAIPIPSILFMTFMCAHSMVSLTLTIGVWTKGPNQLVNNVVWPESR